ncbi:MAG: hypothetical protein ABSF32_00960 [Ignavibacteria bacterium]
MAKKAKSSKRQQIAQTSKASKTKQPVFEDNKYFIYGLFFVFSILVYLASTYKITGDDDFFWHLATGRYIVETKVVPDKDIFGFATQGVEWMPFEWGWDLLTYGLYNIGGYNIIMIFRSLVFVFIFYLYFVTLRKFKINSVVIFILLFILLIAIMDRLSPRPHIITYVFFVTEICLLMCFRYFDRDKYLKKLYFLPFIFLLWGNIHMGVLAGGLLLFIFTISEILIYLYPGRFSSAEIKPLTPKQLKTLFIISVLCALVLLLNPHGLRTYIYAYDHTKMKLLETVNEWRSPFDEFFGSGFIVLLYKVFLFSGVLILIYSYLKKDLTFALVYLGFIWYSVRAIRFTVDYEIIITFFLAVSINYFVMKSGKSTSFGKRVNFVLYNNGVKVVLAVFFIYIITQIPSGNIYNTLKYYRVFGYGVNGDFIPVQLFDFMKQNNITGKPYNQFGTGGYLVWNFPDQKNFIDSRNLNDVIFNEYDWIMMKHPGFEKKIDDYGFDYVIYLDPDLIRRPNDLQRNVVSYFANNKNWKLVFWDDKSMLFLKDEQKFRDIIDKYEYKILKPYTALFNRAEFEKSARQDLQQTKDELNRKGVTEPQGIIYQSIDQELRSKIPGL